jgi:hypothetical protein
MGSESLQSSDGISDEGFLYFLLPETLADFLELVELCKGLAVDP